MYHSCPHPPRLQSRQHTEQKTPTLESSRINLEHEERNRICRRDPHPPSKVGNGRGRMLS